MVFQVPFKPLDNDCLPGWTQAGENGKNKLVKQYKMKIIAHRTQSFRNQNWKYGHRNIQFGLNADFRGVLSYFFRDHPNFKGISGTFSGVSTILGVFGGFSGISGVAGHPVRSTQASFELHLHRGSFSRCRFHYFVLLVLFWKMASWKSWICPFNIFSEVRGVRTQNPAKHLEWIVVS